MCGIVGAVAQRDIVPVLLEGLKRLEYRGYDSCGVAVHQQGLKRSRSVSRVAELESQVAESISPVTQALRIHAGPHMVHQRRITLIPIFRLKMMKLELPLSTMALSKTMKKCVLS